MSQYSHSRRPRSAAALPLALALLFAPAAEGVRWTDFRQRDATNGWQTAGTSYSSDRGLKFAEPGAFAQRASDGGAITSVTVVTYCSGARLDAPFTLAAGATADALVPREPPIAYVYTRYATNAFTFAEAEGIHVVRILSTAEGEVKGNYYLTAVGEARTGEDPEGGTSSGGEASPGDVGGCWRVSEFAGGARCEGFAWATNVTKATPWENGVTVPGFHAFRNGEAVVSVGRDSGRAAVAGLYASCPADGPRTLSLLGSSGAEMTLELHVLNDGREALAGAQVEWAACQWTFPESEPRALSFDWAVTRTAERPAEDAWRKEEGAGLASVPAAPDGAAGVAVARAASCDRAGLPPGGMLWLRWRAPRLAGCPMFGVGNVRVAPVHRRGTVLFVR